MQEKAQFAFDREQTLLEKISFGASAAENEFRELAGYYLDTDQFQRALRGEVRLVVGRKGSGKTAIFALAETECRLSALGCGLDPGIGFIHTDTANRDSLALDLIEPIRPAIEAWILDWLIREPLRRSDFFEAANGNCRISSELCSKLSETAPTWGKLVAPWAEYVAHSLLSGRTSQTRSMAGFKTPLTQRHRREAKGAPAPDVEMPKAEHACRGCGKPIRKGREDCGACTVSKATARMADAARIGRTAARKPDARAKHSESLRRHALARSSWDVSSQPAWLTSEFFSEKVQPLLANISTSTIRSRIGVSRWYASKVRQGYQPHQRHWRELADLVGVPTTVLKQPGLPKLSL